MLSRKRILIVDDEPLVCEIIRAILETPGTIFHVCHNCKSARNEISENYFDCILLDNNLPDGTGIDMLDVACENSGQVILISGDGAQSDLRKQALEGGASAVFAKPFDVYELLACIDGG